METTNSRKVSCVANYAYEASEPDELSLRPGDVLRDVERLPGGWWRGELRGRRGMFPDNFVTLLNESTPNSYRTSGIQGRCRAVFSYQPANPDELQLCVGDELEVVGEVEEGWWQGRRQGRLGVFPSNFVVMIAGDAPNVPNAPPPAYEPAPALPPKPVKELCRVLFPYTAVNEDELSLCEGDVVTLVSRDAPDRGWWRGELRGRVGLFPDNFVQMLPPTASGNTTPTPPGAPTVTTALSDPEDKKPERPLSKGVSLPKTVLNKYSEKTSSIKELTTAKMTSIHKDLGSENVTHKESTITHTNKSDSEKSTHSETAVDGLLDGQGKKPPVPMKKSPTPASGVGGLLSGLKNKMLSTSDKDKSNPSLSSSTSASNSTSSGEWDRPDGGGASRPQPNANTFDHIERNSILNDPRAGRVKAPRRRPPSQVLRDDLPQQLGLSNGQHDANAEKPHTEKIEEIKPKSREWEKHRAPWMEELKLNQAKKTSLISEVGKSRSVSEHSPPVAPSVGKATGSTDRILDCGLEEKKSTHSMEMSRSTSSISSRMSVLETFEETKVRHSLDSKKDTVQQPKEPEVVVIRAAALSPAPVAAPATHSPTAAGRTFSAMVDEAKKPPAPAPPVSSVRTSLEPATDKNFSLGKTDKPIGAAPNRTEKNTTEKHSENVCNFIIRSTAANGSEAGEKTNNLTDDKSNANVTERTFSSSTLERRLQTNTSGRPEDVDVLISQLNDRISNLEKLLEVQNAKFNAALDELNAKLALETEKRQALQAELEKLSHCVTQV